MKDYQLDGNKEMVALGAMNIVGSMTSCYVATGNGLHALDDIMSSTRSQLISLSISTNSSL